MIPIEPQLITDLFVLKMLLFLQILTSLSCDLLDLPADMTFFSPTYDRSLKIETSGQFYAPKFPIEWTFEVLEVSWFRVTIEPKYFSLHATFSSDSETESKTILSSKYGQFSLKLKAGSYSIQLDPDAFEEVSSDNVGCTEAYLYLNLALNSLKQIPKNSIKEATGFSHLSDLSNDINYNSLSVASPSMSLKTSEVKDFLHSYNFTISVPTSEEKAFGATGLSKINFVLSKF
jgi:hypothetical protein